MLNEEVAKYRELSGDTNPNVPISRIGGYLDGYEEALWQTRWIPVSERLPEDGRIVLFCDIDGDIMVGYHVKGRPDTHFSQDGTFDDMKNVRAWMPLPEPYVLDTNIGKMEESEG